MASSAAATIDLDSVFHARRDTNRISYRVAHNKRVLFGGALLALIVLSAILAPVLATHEPNAQIITERLQPAGASSASTGLNYLFGTDHLGRDTFSRVLYGGRISLTVGLAAVVLAGTSGVIIGLISGFLGGIIDATLMRIADIQLAFPFILLALMVLALAGSSLLNVIVVLAISGWVVYARTIRGVILSLKKMEYVTAARCVGASNLRIVWRHLLPGVISPITVVATSRVATIIIIEASLSFLGIGIQPPTPSWGRMLADSRDYLTIAPWIAVFPGLAIVLTVLAVNTLGDGLNDAFNPKRIA